MNRQPAWRNARITSAQTDCNTSAESNFERSIGDGGIQAQPFETDTCIGQWHYKKDIEYKSVAP